MIHSIRQKQDTGYTLLFAVITASLVLGVAIFILNVSRKQFELSVSARNSVYAFYAADSAIECVVNGTNWTNSGGFASTTGGSLNCGSGSVTFTAVGSPSISPSGMVIGTSANPIRQQSGSISLLYNDGSVTTKQCAQVIITTGTDPNTSQPVTIVDARGYNLCVTSPSVAPDVSNTGTVERALRLKQAGVW